MPQLGALAVAVDRLVRSSAQKLIADSKFGPLRHEPWHPLVQIPQLWPAEPHAPLSVTVAVHPGPATSTACALIARTKVHNALVLACEAVVMLQDSTAPFEVFGAAAPVRADGAAAAARARGVPLLLGVAGRLVPGIGPQRAAESGSRQSELARTGRVTATSIHGRWWSAQHRQMVMPRAASCMVRSY